MAGRTDSAGCRSLRHGSSVALIDHTLFTTSKGLVHKMQRIDRVLWDKMLQLSDSRLQDVLGAWVRKREIHAVVERRDRMQQVIAKMVAVSGEQAVFIR